MTQVEFSYNGVSTIVQCNLNEKMKDIFQKFKEKAQVGNKNIFYSYDGKTEINKELTFEEVASPEDKTKNKMNIIVLENKLESDLEKKVIIKSKNIICPECKENIKMEIKNFKINLYECQNGHKMENILLNEFEYLQNKDLNSRKCDICNKINNDNFYKCLTCNNNICPLCTSNHCKNHKIINYDDKYYLCKKHNEKYITYCDNCKINLCALCEPHKSHNKITYSDVLPNKEELFEKKKELKDKIYLINNDIKVLINILNSVMNNINIYYKINEDIIDNYNNNENLNYETIYYLNQFKADDSILNELNKIIECNNIKDKFNNIFNIYTKMNIDELNIIYKVTNKEVKLFNESFIKKNKNNCKLIINEKEQELKEKYNFGLFSSKKDTLKIKLKGITNIINAADMFDNCKSLLSLPDIDKWDTSNITNMAWMFSNCSLLSLPNISKWNISNVVNTNHMFYGCSLLESLPDISEWDTSNVKDMSHLFRNCKKLSSLPDISKWNTSNVTNISYMFYGCSALSSLPEISKWDTSKVTDMFNMFYDCKNSLIIPTKFKK